MFFFFKQKTAYEMRISDWSSDVCSSDLENAHTMATLHQLEAIGVRIALDDFGTGYSSLGYLRKANFSKIKIDRSFVRGAAQNSDESVAIIRAIVAMAGSLGMETTAEGAETEDDRKSTRLNSSH